jgi:DnaJ-class molecular chaperone
MKRVLSSDGMTCPTCKGRGTHGSIMRGGYAEKMVCKTCDGYGRLRAVRQHDEWAYTVMGHQLTLAEVMELDLKLDLTA